MDNDNMNRGTSTAYTDSDKTSSTHKRSHKQSALPPAAQQQYKQRYATGLGLNLYNLSPLDSFETYSLRKKNNLPKHKTLKDKLTYSKLCL